MRRALAPLVLALAVLLAACARPAADPAPLRILAVGDSITAQCAPAGTTGWCGRLLDLLAARGIAATVTVAATSGAACGPLAAGLGAGLTAGVDLVVINCGTNNDTSTQAARDALGAQWRTLVEAAHVGGAMVLPVLIQYSDPEVEAAAGRSWLVPSEVRANDILYSNWHYYQPAGWFAGTLDLQQIPGDRDYLADGVHPGPLGQYTIAALTYRALRAYYGWPDDVPQPCGMWGHRPDPAYLQYVSFIPCTATTGGSS